MTRGGKRPNSGPKRPMSPYGEKTSVIRVPVSAKALIIDYLKRYKGAIKPHLSTLSAFMHADLSSSVLERPIYSGKISAGQSRFPSPAQDYEQETLDLNKRFISNPPATYFFTVKGDSMIGAGIMDGATAIVNADIKPKSSSIIVAAVNGEWMVKRLYKRGSVVKLLSENPAHPPIIFAEGEELIVFGVVTYVINPIS